MKMNKKTISPYNKTLSILAICFCLILTLVLFNPTTQAFADFNDISDNTLVNFNQIANWYSLSNQYYNFSAVDNNGYSTITLTNQNIWWARLKLTNTTFVESHKYYVKQDNDKSYNMVIFKNTTSSNPTDYMVIQSGSSAIITGNNDFGFGYQSATANYFPLKQRIIVIDLTLMFGNNEPTLQQANEYFMSEYYNYTTGIEIPFGKSYLQGYQEGAQSVYESMTITYNSYTIGANSQTYSNNTIERGMLEFDQQYSAYAFSGVIAINLLGEIQRGTNISIDFELTIPDLQGESSSYAETFTLYFAYVDSNNNLVNITGINAHYLSGWTNQYRGDFAMPITTSTIYCYLNYNTIGDNFGPTQAIAFKSDITFVGLDVAQLVNNAYNKGASDTTQKYSVGGVLYQSIYDLGKAEGIAEGNSYATGLDVIATTFTQVFSIFNIEILPGIPLTIFILLPLLFGLIMFIVKLTKGD